VVVAIVCDFRSKSQRVFFCRIDRTLQEKTDNIMKKINTFFKTVGVAVLCVLWASEWECQLGATASMSHALRLCL